jgi:hypothetical protein
MAGNVKVTLDGAGNGAVEIDGHDLSRALRGFTLNVSADERPTIELDFCLSEVEITSMGDGERTVLVNIPDAVVHTLLMIGWTPPENDARTYRLPHAQWVEYTPTRDEYCTCPEQHDPFLMLAHHSTCYYEQNSPDAND